VKKRKREREKERKREREKERKREREKERKREREKERKREREKERGQIFLKEWRVPWHLLSYLYKYIYICKAFLRSFIIPLSLR
jgi:hypothetical protein